MKQTDGMLVLARVLMMVAIAGGLVILGTGCVAGQASVMGAPSAPQSIVGSWRVDMAGIPGWVPGEPRFLTFTSDGTVVVLNARGNGAWVRTGDHTVAVTFFTINYDGAGGSFSGTVKTRMVVTLNATFDGYTCSAKVDRFDAQGSLVRSFDYTAPATRIRVETP
jgi:hypothetical protein